MNLFSPIFVTGIQFLAKTHIFLQFLKEILSKWKVRWRWSSWIKIQRFTYMLFFSFGEWCAQSCSIRSIINYDSNRELRGQENLKLKETINLQKLTVLQRKLRILLYTVAKTMKLASWQKKKVITIDMFQLSTQWGEF